MTRNYFLQYTQLDIPEFRETLVQFMEYVKKSIDERTLHKMEYDSRVNERQTQTTEEKIDTSNALDALDASSVIIESNGTESQKQMILNEQPIYDEEPMAEVQMTADDNVYATGQQHTEQPESNNKGEVDQNADQCVLIVLTRRDYTHTHHITPTHDSECTHKNIRECERAARYSTPSLVPKSYLRGSITPHKTTTRNKPLRARASLYVYTTRKPENDISPHYISLLTLIHLETLSHIGHLGEGGGEEKRGDG
ncbi:hypothetical protein Tco_0133848 [Tanacetum coccineum]